jgi:hypothetical protein
VRRQAHDGSDLINQLLVELWGIHDPSVLHDCLYGWAALGLGAHAVIYEIQSCLWMPLHALRDTGVVLLEEPMLSFLLIVKEVRIFWLLIKRWLRCILLLGGWERLNL